MQVKKSNQILNFLLHKKLTLNLYCFQLDRLYLYLLLAEDSSCDDKDYSSVNDRLNNIWLNPEVYFSSDACKARSQDDSKF